MLQRAASNAYSWWWVSHVRTKQSKWLEQSLQDMGDKVETVLKLITQDGDSFAKRAEMYYKHRPDLINFVEESFRAYQSLAERFDHISKELQNANNTLASAFPDQFQYQIDDDDDDEFPSPRMPRKFPIQQPPDPNAPKAPPQKFPTKRIKAMMSLTNSKNTSSKVVPKSAGQPSQGTKSGLTKSEALIEIDKLQKQILTFQTEKEFAKSSYESGYAKYWNIEEEIAGMQDRISKLQDEFGISQAIDDDEARTVMAEAAIKSCQDTLAQLQEEHERGAEQAKAEQRRIMDARDRLRSLKGDLAHDGQVDASTTGDHMIWEEKWGSFNDAVDISGESKEIEILRDKIKEHFDVGDTNMLTVSEMAEKIDELVSKVINLEAAVSSQTALIHTLRSESDELQTHIKKLEDDKANLIEGKNDLSDRMSEMEKKLKGLHDLDRTYQQHDNTLKTHFIEARSNLDTISNKLHYVELDEGLERSSQSLVTPVLEGNTGLVQDLNNKNMNFLTVNQSKDGQQPMSTFESSMPFKMSDPQTEIQPTLEESKSITLLTDQSEEAFNNQVEEQNNPQQQRATQSTNVSVTPQEVQSDEPLNHKVEDPLPHGTQPQPATLSTNEDLTPYEVQFKENPNGNAEEPVNLLGTQQQQVTTSDPVAPQKVQSEIKTISNEEKPINPQGTQRQLATLSTNEAVITEEVQSDEKTIIHARESVNPQGIQEQHVTIVTSDPVTPKKVQLEETVNMVKPITPQGSQQQFDPQPTNDQVTQHVQTESSASVQKDEPVTLEEVLSRESVSDRNERSNAPSSAPQHEDEPDWQQLFMKGLEGREMVLLAEYTNTLRNYKEAKKRLAEIEKKSQLDVLGIEAQLREQKKYNAMKDEEIQALRRKLNTLQRRLEECRNAKEENDFALARYSEASAEEEDIGVIVVDDQDVSPVEKKLRADIDEILEENLDFWMRFSASFGQIQKFKSGVQDLFTELSKVEKEKEQERKEGNGGGSEGYLKSDIRPIYKHLREIKTELGVWLEQSEKLKQELERRISQLCNIEEEIKHALNAGAADDEMKFTSYNAAKFQGEVANMQQENNKVADELEAGMDHISSLRIQVERRITMLNEELGLQGSKSQNENNNNNNNQMRSASRGRVPLRSFIFGGIKQQKKKASIFSIMHPPSPRR